MTREQMAALDQIRERIKVSTRKRDVLLEDLGRSIALQAFVPDAFAKGRCHTVIRGSESEGFLWILIRGDGSEQVHRLEDVPEHVIHPSHLKYVRFDKRTSKWKYNEK